MATGVKESQKAFVTDVKGTQQTGTINAGATTWVTLPYTRPQGYTGIGLQQLYVQGSNVVVYQWSVSRSSDIISVAIRNMGSSAVAYTVDATVVCIKTS